LYSADEKFIDYAKSEMGEQVKAGGIKAVIFDLDGTLVDTLGDLTDATNEAMKAVGHPLHTRAEVRSFIGNGIPVLIKRALGDDQSGFERALSEFRRYYDLHSTDKSVAYDGVAELIAWLTDNGIKTAVVTNKYDSAAKIVTKKTLPPLDEVVGVSDGVNPKPAPDGILLALKLLGVEPSETVYVGDSQVDCDTSQKCGLKFIGAGWGFGCITSPSVIAKTPLEIIQILADDIPEIFTIS